MSDFKSKLPDFKEVTSMAGKIFKDVKTSICEVIDDYKKKRATEATPAEVKPSSVKPATHTKPKEDEVTLASADTKEDKISTSKDHESVEHKTTKNKK